MEESICTEKRCLHVTETPGCSAVPIVLQPLITLENTVCKLPHRVLSPCDCAHRYSHEIWRSGAVYSLFLQPSWLNGARPGMPRGMSPFHVSVEEKCVGHIAFQHPSLPRLESTTTKWIWHDKSHQPWIQSWGNKTKRLICCPSNPDYLFKPKFNFLIKCWKKFLQWCDYSWKKVQGTNKLPPPAPSQTVLAA